MKIFARILIPVLLASASAEAAVISLTGTFYGTILGRPGRGEAGPVIWNGDGLWAVSYDSSLVPVTGNYSQSISLDSFAISQNVGTTVYTQTNTAADASFVDGQLKLLVIGGQPGGASNLEFRDFKVAYDVEQQWKPELTFWVINNTLSSASVSGGTFSGVPEPSTAVFAYIASILLTRRRR